VQSLLIFFGILFDVHLGLPLVLLVGLLLHLNLSFLFFSPGLLIADGLFGCALVRIGMRLVLDGSLDDTPV
jgi:hypothetical protein